MKLDLGIARWASDNPARPMGLRKGLLDAPGRGPHGVDPRGCDRHGARRTDLTGSLLPDTHVVLWLDAGDPRLKVGTRDIVDGLWLAVGTAFLADTGRISLDCPPKGWIERFLDRPAGGDEFRRDPRVIREGRSARSQSSRRTTYWQPFRSITCVVPSHARRCLGTDVLRSGVIDLLRRHSVADASASSAGMAFS